MKTFWVSVAEIEGKQYCKRSRFKHPYLACLTATEGENVVGRVYEWCKNWKTANSAREWYRQYGDPNLVVQIVTVKLFVKMRPRPKQLGLAYPPM